MIVVVDDEATILKFCEHALTKGGYTVVTEQNPERALKLLEDLNPELIISDIVMPDMDGFQFRKEYVTKHPYRRTPFVFFTCLTQQADEIKGLEQGADDYLKKPIDPALLVAKVGTILRMRRRNLSTTFEGSLRDFSIRAVLGFCKRTSLTGALILQRNLHEELLTFKCGKLLGQGQDHPENQLVEQYKYFRDGHFQILATPPDLDELRMFIRDLPPAEDQTSPSKGRMPHGLLSAVRFGKKAFDIQTEIITGADTHIRATVYIDGKLIHKDLMPIEEDWGYNTIRQKIQAFHNQTIKNLKTRLKSKMAQPTSSAS